MHQGIEHFHCHCIFSMISNKLTQGKSLGKGSTRSKMSVKSAKMYPSLQKGANLWDPKPQQVKKVFEALKKGLNEYLEMHQAELDYLSECHKDTRRNSRLAFYYDLDKQIRCVERYIRKLEFHISKVEELYEAYSIQCRLRDGASNMKHAFSLSPSTKASRESLVELYKNLQECTEDMCLIEGTLEVHLGEFHLKMKGLVGYARLCPGDQYEVFIRLGRQKWKLRGKILTDDSQTWDEEEKIFIPNLHEKFEIKVTELRGLSTLLVGMVTCDSIDFFMTRPQTIIVDITELGTIKLQLEVLWNPFDRDNLILSPGSTTKFSMGSRKSSIYSWTPPSTPSFRDKYYLSVFQQGKKQTHIGDEAQDPCILSYLASCDFNMRLRSTSHSLTEMTEGSSFSSEDQKGAESRNVTPPSIQRVLPLAILQDTCVEREQQDILLRQPLSRRTLDILQETPHAVTALTVPSCPLDQGKGEGKCIIQDWSQPSLQQGKVLSAGQRDLKDEIEAKPAGSTRSVQKTLQEVLHFLKLQHPGPAQLEELEYQVFCIRGKLKPKKYYPKHSSVESLMVETVLESFDFLNADCSADELSSFGSLRTRSISTSTCNDGTFQSLGYDTKAEKEELTTGSDDLDTILEVHLQFCKALLQKLLTPNLAPIVQESLLEEVSRQKHVLEIISALAAPVPRNLTSVEEIIHKAKKQKHCLKIWSECTEQGSILFCPIERFWNPLKYILMFKTKEKYQGHLEKVLQMFLEQIVGGSILFSSANLPIESVTLFQFYSYLEKQHVSNLEKYLARFAKEVMLTEDLQHPGRMKKIKKLKGQRLNQLQPLPQTLQLLALLQLDENHRVGKAATSCLSRAAANRKFREKALLFYTDFLSNEDAKLQQAACLALKNLRGIESIEQIARLCLSETEEVRNAARETTLSFGEKGRLAFEKMDKICCELRDTMYQEAEIEITVF
ncbi:RIPOR family member 3 isoform X2 [Hemicordylus capensis]|uniref:RIPOR family member 3 isoform X2 n=1 Tax=Hemicordylus capensis TaxID=884348 RepID=UPI002302710B|nr:RIPOR family member 3 isoform X2 [Hemicordylus capensis]XP_053106803.1 RIPOR family member 3 isoform X2 [Hemicordylus capensis]XP_053106804.1 RIPOR family member 3 isoform X2 [Hemicordylus capensis]